jgi:hypothetical protein
MKPPIQFLAASLWLAGIGSGLSADLLVGLVAYWPLDIDNSGTTPIPVTETRLFYRAVSPMMP